MLAAGLCVNLKRSIPHDLKRDLFPLTLNQRRVVGVNTSAPPHDRRQHVLAFPRPLRLSVRATAAMHRRAIVRRLLDVLSGVAVQNAIARSTRRGQLPACKACWRKSSASANSGAMYGTIGASVPSISGESSVITSSGSM